VIETRQTPEGKHGLYVDGVMLGESKLQCDAELAKKVLQSYISKHKDDYYDSLGILRTNDDPDYGCRHCTDDPCSCGTGL